MRNSTNQAIADLFARTPSSGTETRTLPVAARAAAAKLSFSYLFFSDVRKSVSDREKYRFARELVEFADQSGFEAVYFPERHFYEFGSIYANNGIVAAYFAPLTKNVRLRTAAVTSSLHHPVEIVENWAIVDILSDGRVDLGFGDGWNKPDFVLSPDTYENRVQLRNERIPVIQKLWRGETLRFPGPGGEEFPITVYPRPIQKELNVWYVTTSERGFAHAGRQGYNVFTMLYGFDLNSLGKKIEVYRQARNAAGLNPHGGCVSLMMHTFVHPDPEWIQRVVASPFKEYIRSSLVPHMQAANREMQDHEIDKMVDYSYARYFQTGGIFGPLEDCQRQIDKAIEVGVNEIAFLQDFGVDYDAVKDSLVHLKQLVDRNLNGHTRNG
jgi:natural product biosynthesis luciferase-like monooxygenase protein